MNNRDKKVEGSLEKSCEEGATLAGAGTILAVNGLNTGTSGLKLALKGFGVAAGSGIGFLALDYIDMKSK